jgi:hypothetical protein
MHWLGFKPRITTSEQAKTVHALDRAATVTGLQILQFWKLVHRYLSDFLYLLTFFLACQTFLNSTLAGDVRPNSRPGRFNPGETAPGTHCVGGWVGSRVDLGVMKKKNLLSLQGIESRFLGLPGRRSPVAIPTPLSVPIFYEKLKYFEHPFSCPLDMA